MINTSEGAVYTFHTPGLYTDSNNWDVYPGTVLLFNDTISIEANIESIQLLAFDGYIVFEEDVSSVGIVELTILEGCQLEFKQQVFAMDIAFSFTHNSFNPIIAPDFAFIELFNSGAGITSNTCMFDTYVDFGYTNYGTQDSYFLECMNGSFSNFGIIEVSSNTFYLNCSLELFNGIINGNIPFEFHQFNGHINSDIPGFTATINNIISLHLNSNTSFMGSVILNAPD